MVTWYDVSARPFHILLFLRMMHDDLMYANFRDIFVRLIKSRIYF